jgi:hypothetical protein
MLKLVLFCLAIGSAAAQGEPNPPAPAAIVLYTQFQAEPPQAVAEALQAAVDNIMQPIGLRFEWRSLSEAHGDEVTSELAVITVKGRCDTTGLGMRSKVEGALGFTHISDGQILPFAELSCDRLRNFVQGELVVMPMEDREAALGRALGRVLAHELYHIFANTTRHGAGVSKESYTVRDLTCDDFQFQHKESLMLRARREHALSEAAVVATASNM